MIARRRISDDATGFAELLAMLAAAGDDDAAPIPVAIETSRGLLVACLRATGRPVYAINPLAASRYRDRYGVSGKKSDHGDALVLANILRTDATAHRQLPADSELVQAIQVLARAQQDAVWGPHPNQQQTPGAAQGVLPGHARRLRQPRRRPAPPGSPHHPRRGATPRRSSEADKMQLRALLRKAGRQRGIDAEADRLHAIFRATWLRQLPGVEA